MSSVFTLLRVFQGTQRYRTKNKRITMKVKQKIGANLPGAWVVNPKDRGRKSIKSDKIYLEDNSNFEIEIFNPLQESVLADIRLNGNSISKSGLVIKPGQRLYLDCFVDCGKKFVFQTYQIENSQESIEATESNGLLEVFFYKEQVVSLQNWNDRFHKIIIHEYYPRYYYPSPWWNPYILCGTTNTVSSNHLTLGNCGSSGITFTNTSSYNSGSLTSGTSQGYSMYNNSIETGRVERGEKSNQKFVDVDMDFEKNYIHHLVYQLLPVSRKPYEANDISKTKKIKHKFKHQVELTDIFKRETEEVIELIKKLSDLHSAGILTDDEFSAKKSELLAKI